MPAIATTLGREHGLCPDGTAAMVHGRRSGMGLRNAEPEHPLTKLEPEVAATAFYLASRVDVFAACERRRLMAVRDARSPMPMGDVLQLLSRELGAPPAQCFQWIEPEPHRSRLLTQCHRARLLDGRPVELKLSRVADREPILELEHLEALLTPAQAKTRERRLREVLDDARRSLVLEIDLTTEALDSTALRADAEELALLAAPVVHHRLSSPRVLVSDALDGVTLDRLSSGESAGSALRGRQTSALQLARVWLYQTLLGRRFPRWPRPENITLSARGRLAFNGGGFSRLEPADREALWQYLQAMVDHDPERAYSALLPWLEIDDPDRFRARFLRLTPSHSTFNLGDTHLLPIQLLLHEQLLADVASPLPTALRDFYRSLFWLHTTVRQLAPERDVLLEAFESIAVRRDLQDLQRRLQLPRLAADLQQAVAMWGELPQELDHFLTRASSPSAHRRPSATRVAGGHDLLALLALLISALVFQSLASMPTMGILAERLGAIVLLTLGAILLISPGKGR